MATGNTKRKFEKLPRYTFPRGVFVYPSLHEARDNFNKDGKEYSTGLRLSAQDGQAVRAHFAPILAEAIAAGRATYDALPLQTRKKIKFQPNEEIGVDVVDEATEKETGEVLFKFKRKSEGVSKDTGKPWSITLPVFDGKGVPMKGVPVWGGSEGRLTVEYAPYFVPGTGAAGLRFVLVAAQVLKLVGKGERSADEFGFGVEEDGYEYEPSEDVVEETEAAGEEGTTEGSDF